MHERIHVFVPDDTFHSVCTNLKVVLCSRFRSYAVYLLVCLQAALSLRTTILGIGSLAHTGSTLLYIQALMSYSGLVTTQRLYKGLRVCLRIRTINSIEVPRQPVTHPVCLFLRWSFDEGRIVELNNQCHHAVDNLCLHTHRIHLILDYLEEEDSVNKLPARITLTPEAILKQSRRSVDLASDKDSVCDCDHLVNTLVTFVQRKCPSFIILGAQKCGTTFLFESICAHPLCAAPKRRETHYFDWRWNAQLSSPDGHLQYCELLYCTRA
jgi:hypothetical protein